MFTNFSLVIAHTKFGEFSNLVRTYIITTSLSNVDQVQYPLCSMRNRVMCLVVSMYYVVKKLAAWGNMF